MQEISELEVCIMYLTHSIIYLIVSIYMIVTTYKDNKNSEFNTKVEIIPYIFFLLISLMYVSTNIIKIVRL